MHHSIWKILFVLGAYEYLERKEGKIRKCLFFYVRIFKNNSVGLEFRVLITTPLSSDVWWSEFWLYLQDYLQNFNTKHILFLWNLNYFKFRDTTIEESNEETSSGETHLMVNEGAKSGKKKESNVSRQHQVLWNLFAHNLDSVIMSLIESDHFKIW